MTYLRNCWYVAAWSEEIGSGSLLGRRLLDQPVVLFRDRSGTAAALDDMCPHRFAPLTRGRVIDGEVQCGYHGLRFGGTGHCTHSPQPGWKVPRDPMVRSYPVVEQQGVIWIWMGEPELAARTPVPDMPLMSDPAWQPVRGRSLTPSNYILSIENLLDLSHPEFLHDGSLGSPALRDAHYQVIVESDRVIHSNRWFDEGPIPPAFEQRFPTGGRMVEHWVNMRWEAPSNLWLWGGATFPGRPREEGLNSYTAHLLTPETDQTTHYFWCLMVQADVLTPEQIAATRARLADIFDNEDGPMLQAVQERMAGREFWSMRPAILPGDRGGVQVRRNLARLIAQEGASEMASEKGSSVPSPFEAA